MSESMLRLYASPDQHGPGSITLDDDDFWHRWTSTRQSKPRFCSSTSTHPPDDTTLSNTLLYNPIQQSQALRLAPSRCWPDQVRALRASSAPQGLKLLYVVKYNHHRPRARQTPESDGNAASGDGGSSMVHMGADGRCFLAQCPY